MLYYVKLTALSIKGIVWIDYPKASNFPIMLYNAQNNAVCVYNIARKFHTNRTIAK